MLPHEPALLDTFEGRLRLEGVLTTRTGLHIGAGGSVDPLATDAPVVRDASGSPFVPGASLKGLLRSAAERLLRDLPANDDASLRLWTCEHLTGKPCVEHQQVKEWREALEGDARELAREVWKESCTVCRLFGSLALASRVRFPDLPLRGTSPVMEIRNGVGIDRDRELAASGVLYDFEAVPPGTSFDLTVVLDNPREAEVGLVLWLFEQLGQGNLGLGGKTSRGLGQVRIHWEHFHETQLGGGANPFVDMLTTKDLLAEEDVAEESETAEPASRLPESGDRETWQAVAGIVEELPEITEEDLKKIAGERGLGHNVLNNKLDLGIEGARAVKKKTWGRVLELLVECGLLSERDGVLMLAEEAAAEEQQQQAEVVNPRLQQQYDRFVGAMARLWQEAA